MERNKKENAVCEAVAGAGAVFCSRFFTQPLEVIKLKCQIRKCAVYGDLNEKTTIRRQILEIFRKDGFKGFWKGLCGAQVLGLLQGSLLFTFYGEIGFQLEKTQLKEKDNLRNFLTGILAGTASVTVMNPLDVIETRYMAESIMKNEKPNAFEIFRKTLRNEGFRVFFRGTSAGIIQVAPSIGFRFMFFSYYKHLWSRYGEDSKFGSLICGALAGVSSNGIVHPVDVIRRKMQLATINKLKSEKSESQECRKFVKCAVNVYRKEGYRGFFTGMIAGTLKSAVSSSITFLAYEEIIKLLK